ncbi:MAG: PBSX family phage terminase large subunit [Eubacteriales bacterium]|jgi:phage terminase large subunit
MNLIVPCNEIFRPVHRTRARYVVLKGSAGSGKSVDTAQMYLLRLLSDPGRNLVCIRKIDDANRSSTFAEILAAVKRLNLDGFFSARSDPLCVTCVHNRNTVLFRGVYTPAQREKLKSITFPHGKLTDVWIEEANELDPEDFELIDDRLRGELPPNLFYQIKLTFNPVSANHWLKTRFFDARDPSVFTHHSTYRDNRFIDAAFHQRMERRRTQDPDGYRVYGLGEWGVSGGQYFSEWRESLHVCEPFAIPDDWRRYVTLDYGLDMCASFLIALSPDGHAYCTREFYEPGLIISEAASSIREHMFPYGGTYQTFAPPDLWNRRQDSGRSAADIFADCGVPLTRAPNDRVSGWYALREWLKPQRDGFPMLRIFPNCVNLIRTLPALKRDPGYPNDVADVPHELTHAPDALRYFFASQPYPVPVLPGMPESVQLYRGRFAKSPVLF